MMEVKVVEKAKDVFGASVSDFDPWEDGGGFGDDGVDAGFGDFGNFEVMDDENTNDDAFFSSVDAKKSPELSKSKRSVDEGDRKLKTPTRNTSSRRSHPSRAGSMKGKAPAEGKEDEKEDSNSTRKPRAPIRRRGSSRLLVVDGDDEKKDSCRSRSRSSDKDVTLTKVEGTEDETSDKDRSRSGHGGRRDALRSQGNSFRASKRTSTVEESACSRSASRDKSPPKRGVTRRQSSSRRLITQAETACTRLVTQQSVRSLFQNGDLGDAEALPVEQGTDTNGCIVSHSRFQKPSRTRSGLGKSMAQSSQAIKSPEGEPHRRVSRSTSINRKLDGAPSDPTINRRPPQRTRSAVVPRPSSIRRDLSSDNLTLEEHPEEDEDPLSPVSGGSRRRHPVKSKSIGSVSLRERRLQQRQQQQQENGDGGGHGGSLRRSHRRLGSQDGGELKG